MAVLLEGVQYGLSSHFQTENKSLVFVKLTDSALKSIEEFIKSKSSKSPSIQFHGQEGVIRFPSEGNNRTGQCFSFSLSAVSDVGGPQGSFECIQQCGSRSLESLGPLHHKMTIHAKDDVYETTRQRMAVAEEESKRNCTRVIKASGPDIGRKVKVRKDPGSVILPARKGSDSPPTHYSNPKTIKARTGTPQSTSYPGNLNVPAPTTPAVTAVPSRPEPRVSSNEGSNPELARRPLRERLVHMLATRPFKKPELFGRLYQEGLKEKDKKLVMPVLRAIGLMKDNVYHLARHVWNEVHDDWPFYSDQEKQMLKRRRPGNFTPPGSDSSGASGHSPRSQPGDSPTSTRLPSVSTSRVAEKRPLPSDSSATPSPAAKKPLVSSSSHPRKQLDSIGDSNHQLSESRSPGVWNHKPAPSPLKPRASPGNQASPQLPLKQPRSSPSVPITTRVASSTGSSGTPDSSPDSLTENIDRVSTSENAEYLHRYQRIVSTEQRNRYKADFNAEYREYRELHSAMEKVSRRFAQLEETLRQQIEGSSAWQRVKSQIVQEYKANLRGKRRLLYLHEKLAHIKRLVHEWDTSRAQMYRS